MTIAYDRETWIAWQVSRGNNFERKSPVGRKRKVGEREPNGRLSRRGVSTTGKRSLYIINIEGKKIVKIGVAKNPKSRVHTIQTCAHERVMLFWHAEYEASFAEKAEKVIHKYLKTTDVHISGEWYSITPQTARKICEAVIAKCA